MMLMTNDVLAQQFETYTFKSLMPHECISELNAFDPEAGPFVVSVEDISCEDTVFEVLCTSPVEAATYIASLSFIDSLRFDSQLTDVARTLHDARAIRGPCCLFDCPTPLL